MTKLASTLPKEGCGLDLIWTHLVDDPHRQHLVIAVVDCSKTTTDNDTGDVEPTARLHEIEVVTTADIETVAAALTRAREKRTGKAELKLDLPEGVTVTRVGAPG